jgi:hypothetical protein
MTTNKAQEQTFKVRGIQLMKICFFHGQLYVVFMLTSIELAKSFYFNG